MANRNQSEDVRISNGIVLNCCNCFNSGWKSESDSVPLPSSSVPLPITRQDRKSKNNGNNNPEKLELELEQANADAENDDVDVQMLDESVSDWSKLKVPQRPSKFYLLFTFIGLICITGDMFTDGYSAIMNIVLGRYILGILTIAPIILSILAHLSPVSYYKTQENLIPLNGKENFLGYWILKTGTMDPIIWSMNHLLATKAYIDEKSNISGRLEPCREKFYKSKQMLQLSIKTEAQLEASLQAALSLFRLIFYYNEEETIARNITMASLVFSCTSIARAACGDLAKTVIKCRQMGHFIIYDRNMTQGTGWKLPRLLSVTLNTASMLIANVTFVLCWHLHWTEPSYQIGQFFRQESSQAISLLVGTILMILINLVFQVARGIIATRYFFFNDFNLEHCCVSKYCLNMFISWTHFVIRAPLINIFRSANLYYYSLKFFFRFILSTLNTFSLILLFAPFWTHGNLVVQPDLHIGLIYTFFSCIFLSFVCQGLASKFISQKFDMAQLEGASNPEYAFVIRMYQLP